MQQPAASCEHRAPKLPNPEPRATEQPSYRATIPPMTLRVGFDLDGVLADMSAALQREEQRLFGAPDVAVSAEAPREARSLTAAQHERLWREVAAIENFWQTLPEVEPGAIAALAARARFERWEVIFLTSRPETAGDTAQLQTQRWLDVNGFDLPSVFVVSGSRGKIADALDLDVVIDDLPENAMDVLSDSQASAILFWRQPPKWFRRVCASTVAGLSARSRSASRSWTPSNGTSRRRCSGG